MLDGDSVKTAKEGVSLVGEVIKAAGDNEQVREAGQHLGKTAVTLTKAINNCLLPLAAVNFAFEKAQVYFSGKFADDLDEKTRDIPPENLIEPKASVAGPALQGLAFTHEELDLKEMYLYLLKASMDDRVASDAHPAFVEIIKQLTAEEAGLFQKIVKEPSCALPCAEVRLVTKKTRGWSVLSTHLIHLPNTDMEDIAPKSHLPSMLDNFMRLGLVTVDYDTYLTGENVYDWLSDRAEVLTHKKDFESHEEKCVEVVHGSFSKTSLGSKFAQVVGLLV